MNMYQTLPVKVVTVKVMSPSNITEKEKGMQLMMHWIIMHQRVLMFVPMFPIHSSREEEPPCQTINEGVIVDPFHKSDGKRVYDKRHYCLYCLKPFAKMARHLEHAHIDKADVAKALSFPKGSKERKNQLDYICNRGNYAHNAAVMKLGKGKLMPSRRPPKEAKGDKFLFCVYCQSFCKKDPLAACE